MKIISRLLSIACLFILFSSCKKNKDETNSTDYYLSANFGGTVKTFKADAFALRVQIDTTASIDFTAAESAGSENKVFLIIELANKQITTGTYTDRGPDDEVQIVVGGYNPVIDEEHIYAAGLQVDNNPRLSVTINTLTDKIATGAFSGTFYDHGGDGPGILAVTDGKFNLPVKQ